MGETILGNRYEIIRKIGDGGMAFVYEAKDRLLNRIVAVKVLRPEFVDDEEFLAKFKREAEAVANISHPNIVNVYDVGCDGKVNYIVMEYVDGQNLKEIIKNEGTLDEYTALDITKQIAKQSASSGLGGGAEVDGFNKTLTSLDINILPKSIIYVILFMSLVLIISLVISSISSLKKNPKELLIDTK